jgi:CheY-like chemotaxis protein
VEFPENVPHSLFFMKKITAILVDDSPEDREMAIRTLGKYKFIDKVISFREGDEALDFLNKNGNGHQEQFIFLDLNMPRMGGLEFIGKIKANEKTKNIPIAVLTSTTELPAIKESMKMGVKYYISKPMEFEDVERIALELGFTRAELT